jgi:hypothetical protein
MAETPTTSHDYPAMAQEIFGTHDKSMEFPALDGTGVVVANTVFMRGCYDEGVCDVSVEACKYSDSSMDGNPQVRVTQQLALPAWLVQLNVFNTKPLGAPELHELEVVLAGLIESMYAQSAAEREQRGAEGDLL